MRRTAFAAVVVFASCQSGTKDFSLVIAPNQLQLVGGADAQAIVGIGRTAGMSDTVNLTVGALPPGVTATFSPAAATTTISSLTVSAPSLSSFTPFTVIVTGTSGTLTHTATFTLSSGTTGSGGAGGATGPQGPAGPQGPQGNPGPGSTRAEISIPPLVVEITQTEPYLQFMAALPFFYEPPSTGPSSAAGLNLYPHYIFTVPANAMAGGTWTFRGSVVVGFAANGLSETLDVLLKCYAQPTNAFGPPGIAYDFYGAGLPFPAAIDIGTATQTPTVASGGNDAGVQIPFSVSTTAPAGKFCGVGLVYQNGTGTPYNPYGVIDFTLVYDVQTQ